MKGRNCMTAVYQYEELVQAYDNFMVPAVAIYVNNGKEDILSAKKLALESMQVTLSVEQTSGISFRIVDVFDMESHSIKPDIKNSFSVGTIIEVAMGYGSNLTTVFKGYVTEYKTIYQDIVMVCVVAVDLRKLLMSNRRKQYKYAANTYSGIFSEILSNYKTLYDTLHVDAVEEQEELIQNDSDYNFIMKELCRKGNRDFFIVGGDVYFKKRNDSENAFIELQWGNNLYSFQKGKTYCNKKMKVYSCQEDKTVNMLSSDVKTGKDTPALTSETLIEEWEIEKGIDKKTLQNWLDKKVEEKIEQSASITCSLVGLPEIVPGRYIKITGVDSADEGTYYIREVYHNFDSDEFITRFTVGEPKDSWVDCERKEDADVYASCRGVMHAVVKENWNEKEPGKVLVEFIAGEEGKKDTKWLPVLRPYCGDGYGFYFHPEIGTEVIVGSMLGDANSLVVFGNLWNQEDQLPVETAEEKNEIKKIRTKGNHEIIFYDNEKSGKVEIHTNKKLHITLDDGKDKITVYDEKEENGLQIDSKEGVFQILAKKKLVLSVGNKDAIVVDGGNRIAVEAEQIAEKAGQSLQLQTQKLEIKGDMTELKASGSMKINSSGITEIKGSMVKIN